MSNRFIYNIGSRATVLLALIAIVGCSSDDCDSLTTTTDGKVAVDMVLSVATPSMSRGVTRMSDVITQNNGDFRGIQDLWLVPFTKAGAIDAGDTPLELLTSEGQTIAASNGAAKYFFDPEAMMMQIGTASFLAYGRATVENNDPFANGSLTASYTSSNNFAPANVTFTPNTIPTTAADDTKADNIAQYLTNIATAHDWCNDNDTKDLFYEFANIHNSVAEPFAGSSTNILKHVNETYKTVNSSMSDGALKTAILDAIKDSRYVTFEGTAVTALSGTNYNLTGYPASLPDGVAGMKWNGSAFVSQPGNDFGSYVYPAELYYYANSRIYTSTAKKREEYETTDTWASFIAKYKDKATNEFHFTVDADTRSIALIDPLQYGVACLAVQIRAKIPTGGEEGNKIYAFDDNYGSPSVALTPTVGNTLGTFPLTAILVGGQHKQGFDFTPKFPDETATGYSAAEDPEFIIYDRNIVSENICLGDLIEDDATDENDHFSDPLYTLTLQTKKDKSVKLVLEFKNNTDSPFKCKSGIIYPGTKFYLMASVVNLDSSDDEKDKQVLTKDHKSTIRLTISNLSNAYNALPSLSSDKVRVFETVTAGISQWQTGGTPSTEIHNW